MATRRWEEATTSSLEERITFIYALAAYTFGYIYYVTLAQKMSWVYFIPFEIEGRGKDVKGEKCFPCLAGVFGSARKSQEKSRKCKTACVYFCMIPRIL